MEASLPWLFLRVVALLREKSLVDAIALASVPIAALLIGATIVLA